MSIEIKNVNYLYSQGTSYEMHALKNVNLEIPDGQFVGLIGHTGSGKSTLTQHLNGLVKATSGHIYYNGEDIYDEKFSMKKLRSKVGLVFQYPEHQLFETEVLVVYLLTLVLILFLCMFFIWELAVQQALRCVRSCLRPCAA